MRPSLLRAYRETTYQAGFCDVRVGRRSLAMDRLLFSVGAREAVFITAYNPFSRVMPPGWNQRMQTRLAETVRRHHALTASGRWRRWSEVHLLVFADGRRIKKLAHLFRQHGIVIVRRRQPARLLVTF
jgi:hypothetical protein